MSEKKVRVETVTSIKYGTHTLAVSEHEGKAHILFRDTMVQQYETIPLEMVPDLIDALSKLII